MSVTVEPYFFAGNGRMPNSRLPLLVYRNVFQCRAAEMEARLRGNQWMPTWHSPIGFFPRHHFHSQSHELIVLIRGEACGQFGGHDGRPATLRKGDAVVIPAGVGHAGISITPDLFVTGAFPAGRCVLDFRHGDEDQYDELVETAAAVPIPYDPFFGRTGPLRELWRAADAGARSEEPVTV
jgi:uncharacterized protein YjlB